MNLKTAAGMILGAATLCPAVHLTAAADSAFDRYVANLESRLARQHATAATHLAMLNVDAAVGRHLMAGDIRVEGVNKAEELPGALLHHWRGAAFVPNATPQEMLALLRDYGRLSQYYAPEIAASHALKDDGESAILAVRMREQKVRTIVLDAEYTVGARLVGNDRGYSFSRSTHIWQVDSAGTSRERRRREGNDEGFLWRLNSYWSFARTHGGLFIECEAVSLTRDVPMGLGWLIAPIVQDMPAEALQFTLKSTKSALVAIANRKARG